MALFEVDYEREDPEAEEGGGACNTTLGATGEVAESRRTKNVAISDGARGPTR